MNQTESKLKHSDLTPYGTVVYNPVAACGGRGLSAPVEEQIAYASACGKAIVVGEHAVVYGAKAVAMPVLNMQVAISLRRRTGLIVKPAMRMYLAGRPVSDHLLGVVEDAAELLNVKLVPMDLHGNSTVLIGAGLGSSAAICVAVLKSLAKFYRMDLSAADVATMATQLEARFHGNPSGLDTAVVSHEQVVSFAKGEQPRAIDVAPPEGQASWRFAILDSGLRSSTLSMIHQAAPYFQDNPAVIESFNKLADNAIAAFANGDAHALGSTMNEAHNHLRQAGVVNEPLHSIQTLALEAGALGAKVTGAGGGGCVLALLSGGSEQIQTLKHTLGSNRVSEVSIP